MPSLLPWATRCSSSTYSSLHLRFLSSLLITLNGCLSAGSSSQLAACNPVVALPRTTSGGRTSFTFVDILLTESTQPLWLHLALSCLVAPQWVKHSAYQPSRVDWRCGSTGPFLDLASAAVHQHPLRRNDSRLPRSAVGAANFDMATRPATPSQETLSPSAKLWAVDAASEGPNSTNLQCLPF